MAKSKLMQVGATTSIINLIQNIDGIATLFGLRTGSTYGGNTPSADVGSNWGWWRVCSIIRLRGAYVTKALADATNMSLYGTAITVTPGNAALVDTACVIPINTIYRADTLNQYCSYNVTVPASGEVKLVFLTTGTAQDVELSGGGATPVTLNCPAFASQTGHTGTASTGSRVTVLTLTGCTPGAGTITATKKTVGGFLSFGGVIENDLAAEIPDTNPAAGRALIYHYNVPDDVCIDGKGVSEAAFRRSGTTQFFNGYHGGQTGTPTIYLDGVVQTLSANTLKVGNHLQIAQNGTLTDGAAATYAYTSNHTFANNAVIFNMTVDGAPVLFTEAFTMMAACATHYNFNGRAFQVDASPVYQGEGTGWTQVSALTGDKLVCSQNVLVHDGNGILNKRAVWGVSNQYNKGYSGITFPQAGNSPLSIGSMRFDNVYQFIPYGTTQNRDGIGIAGGSGSSGGGLINSILGGALL